ncbi:hypothetical protein BDZ89DRAFT_1061606 [Hymenopellis radicata]|nr:hypothetical protein BDZ89DRAFT_1061606 [Hymenopellis radicata]
MQSILDPTYCSKQTTQPRVYIDRKGNMHDPDYRHFPLVASYSTSSTSSSASEAEEEYVDPFSPQRRRSGSLNWSTSGSPRYYPSPPISSSPQSSLPPFDAQKLRKNHIKRRGSLESYLEADEEESEVEGEEYSSDEEVSEDAEEKKKSELSCSEAMKRQLQTISFTMSVGAFRARRRVRKVLSRRATS